MFIIATIWFLVCLAVSFGMSHHGNERGSAVVVTWAFVLFFCPVYLVVALLDRTVGPAIPPSDPRKVARADSLRAAPNCDCGDGCACRAGANMSLGPDRA